MANFGQLTLTKKGLEALLNAQNGVTLKFSKIAMGKGSTSDGYESLTDLVDNVASVDVTSGAISTEKGTYTAEAYFSNESITSGFKWTEIGLFFRDSNGNDILYAAANAGTDGDYIPATTDARYAKYLRITTAIGNATDITITGVDSYTDTITFADHVADRAHQHSNSFVTHDGTGEKYRIGLDDNGEYLQLYTADGSGEKVYVGDKEEIDSHVKNYDNPHKVTKSQLGLDKVENKSAETILSEMTKANVTKALGYTPSESDLCPYVTTTGNGSAYNATVDSIKSLAAGVSFIMIPHVASTTTTPTLNVNSLGSKNIRRRLSGSTASTTVANTASWLAQRKPIRVTYDGTYWIADLPRPDVNDLYGTLPIESGGTGATTAEEARANIGAAAEDHTHPEAITIDEIPNLYVWKKYDSSPNVPVETTYSSAQLSNRSTTSGMTIGGSVTYAESVKIEDGEVVLEGETQSVTYSSSGSDVSVLLGKYVKSTGESIIEDKYDGIYYIPEDATLTPSSTGLTAKNVIKLSVSTFKGYVASKKNGTYPTSGEHTDGLWYEYHKQLGD